MIAAEVTMEPTAEVSREAKLVREALAEYRETLCKQPRLLPEPITWRKRERTISARRMEASFMRRLYILAWMAANEDVTGVKVTQWTQVGGVVVYRFLPGLEKASPEERQQTLEAVTVMGGELDVDVTTFASDDLDATLQDPHSIMEGTGFEEQRPEDGAFTYIRKMEEWQRARRKMIKQKAKEAEEQRLATRTVAQMVADAAMKARATIMTQRKSESVSSLLEDVDETMVAEGFEKASESDFCRECARVALFGHLVSDEQAQQEKERNKEVRKSEEQRRKKEMKKIESQFAQDMRDLFEEQEPESSLDPKDMQDLFEETEEMQKKVDSDAAPDVKSKQAGVANQPALVHNKHLNLKQGERPPSVPFCKPAQSDLRGCSAYTPFPPTAKATTASASSIAADTNTNKNIAVSGAGAALRGCSASVGGSRGAPPGSGGGRGGGSAACFMLNTILVVVGMVMLI